jgi:hypothetical protein
MREHLTHDVKQFSDEDFLTQQTFTIDDDFEGEPWVVVEHDSQELSLSLENWNKLVELANKMKIGNTDISLNNQNNEKVNNRKNLTFKNK